MGAHSIPEPVIAAAPRLRIVAVAAVGYNIVDVAAATRRGILVTNTPGVLTERRRTWPGRSCSAWRAACPRATASSVPGSGPASTGAS